MELDNFAWVRQNNVALSLFLWEYTCIFVFAWKYRKVIVEDFTVSLHGKLASWRFKNSQSKKKTKENKKPLECLLYNLGLWFFFYEIWSRKK